MNQVRACRGSRRPRVGLAGAAPLPGVARDQELIARHVERIEGDAKQLALALVELGVNQRPTLRALVPAFGDPMVDEPGLLEIGAEAAPRSGRVPWRRIIATSGA